MAPVRLTRQVSSQVTGLRTHKRYFTASSRCLVNPLLNLSHFSAAKEAQFLSKHTRVPREEFHPHLQLIRSSEVDPFAPVAGASPSVIAALNKAKKGETDMQTTYTLALSNMMSQLEMSRREASAAGEMMMRMHEKYKRDERSAFLMLLASLALLAGVLSQTDALIELKDKFAVQMEDWKWMGNPPSHISMRKERVLAEQRVRQQAQEVETELRQTKKEMDEILERVKATSVVTPEWKWSNLFWSPSPRH